MDTVIFVFTDYINLLVLKCENKLLKPYFLILNIIKMYINYK
jgi:hypothetical protein